MKTTAEQQTARQKAAADLTRARKKRAAVEAKMNDNWKMTVGMMKDCAWEREAWELGEQWRRAQVDP